MTPIVLLTGFLGSGKTTLLARLLQEPDFSRTAVLINEFGEIGLDHDLIEAGDETVVALSTGCLCCRVSSSIANTLAILQARRAAGEITFERVVIETSGLADPVPILQSIAADRVSGASYTLAAVITVVDAVTGLAAIEKYPEGRRQVAVADMLLVSKMDISTGSPAPLLEALRSVNPAAQILDTRDWSGDVSQIGAPCRSADVPSVRPASLRLRPQRHSHPFSTISFVRERPLCAVTLPLFLEGLSTHLGSRVLRAKGIAAIEEAPERPIAIHAVQHVIYKPVFLGAWPSDDRQTRLVLIGHDLPLRWPSLLLDALDAEVRSTTRR